MSPAATKRVERRNIRRAKCDRSDPRLPIFRALWARFEKADGRRPQGLGICSIRKLEHILLDRERSFMVSRALLNLVIMWSDSAAVTPTVCRV